MKLIVELIHERKAITSLYEAIEKRLKQIEEIENTIFEEQPYSKTTIIPKKEIDCAKLNDQKIKPSSILEPASQPVASIIKLSNQTF